MTSSSQDGRALPGPLMTMWDRFVERPLPWLVGVALVLQALAVGAMLHFDPLLVAGLVVLATLAPLAFGSVPRTLALFIIVLMAIPRSVTWPFIPVLYADAFALPFIGAATLLVLRDRLDRGRFDWYPRSLTPIWAALAAWTLVVVAEGILMGAERGPLVYELIQLGLYGTFFLAMDGLRRPADVRLLFAALLVGMAFVFVEYMAAAALQGSAEMSWGRVVSRQANLAVAVAPALIALFLTGAGRSWMWLLGLGPVGAVVLLSQQRTLFAAFAFSILVVLAMGLRASRVVRRRMVHLVVAFVVLGGLTWTALGAFQATRGGPSVTEGISERTGEVTDAGGTPALVIRLVSFAHVWNEKIRKRPVTGWGLGDKASIPILRGASFEVRRVDNAYVVLWWKSGIIGLALVLLLWGSVLARAWMLARYPNREVQVIAMGVAACLSGNLVLALASSIITHYRFNAIWGVLMAVVLAAERIYPRDADGVTGRG